MTKVKRIQIIMGTVVTDKGKKSVGDRIELPINEADRLIEIGVASELEQAPGYKRDRGMSWVKLKVPLDGAVRAKSGDVVQVPRSSAGNLIRDGHAELVNASNPEMAFQIS